MKTVDLIPLILLELSSEDKYGLDLIKSLESRSKGKIIIKQPTLYTILKKLEKSRFITSYWQDSEIGGKRHYYKLTSNGRQQVATLPSFETLIQNIMNDNTDMMSNDTNNISAHVETMMQPKQSKKSIENDNYSIFDMLSQEKDDSTIAQKESVLPSNEVFANKSIDTITEVEINKTNTELLKDEKTKTDETFACNENVAKFTEHSNNILSSEYKDQLKAIYDSNETKLKKNHNLQPSSLEYDSIKHVDYKDLRIDQNYIQAKITAKNILFKILSTSAYILLMLIINGIVTNFTGKTTLYYISLTLGLIVMIFYPSIYAFYYQKIRLKLVKLPHKINLKKRSIIVACSEIIILLVLFIINICIGKNTISSMFAVNNYANLYAVVLLSVSLLVDLLFTYLFLIKIKNRI